jgi:hypothetical protein
MCLQQQASSAEVNATMEKKMKGCLSFLVVGLVAFLVVHPLTVAGENDDPKKSLPNFKTTTRKKDDAIEVRSDKDKTLFIVKSPSGISQVVIERQADSWPKTVVLRLHLKGLESFRASNGKTTLNAAISFQDAKPKVRQWKDANENAGLDDKSPLWMDVRMLGSDGKPAKAIPLNNGYFEMMLPKLFFEGNPKSIMVSWLDFFR